MELRVSAVAAFFFAGISFGCVAGEQLTGNEFLRFHQQSEWSSLAYAQGFMDGAVAAQFSEGKGPGICPPVGVSTGQARDVLLDAVKSKPSTRHQSMAVIAYFALLEAWPCQK